MANVSKQDFIKHTLAKGILVFGKVPTSLKAGRQAWIFFNAGNADDGQMAGMLGDILAGMINEDIGNHQPVVCFGPPYKGVSMAPLAAVSLASIGNNNARWNSYRKEEKDHGGDTRSILVARGTNIKECDGNVVLIDDVITDGASKDDGLEVLEQLASEDDFKLNVRGIYLLVDRQEVTSTNVNQSAADQLAARTGLKVRAFVTASELIEAAREQKLISDGQYASFLRYFRVYGSPEVLAKYRDAIEKAVLQQPLLTEGRFVVPACDFTDLDLFSELVGATHELPKIGGYKVGSLLVTEFSLPRVVETVRKFTNKHIILDMQKQGTDIPEVVYRQVQQAARMGCDAIILFAPQGGPESLLAGIHSGYEHGIRVIVGADMTHRGFGRDEGGCVTPEDSDRIYQIAASKGIRNFIMPGTKPERIAHYRTMLEGCGASQILIGSPGFVSQGGKISQGGRAAGDNLLAIVGRGIYEKSPGQARTPAEMRAEAEKLTAQL